MTLRSSSSNKYFPTYQLWEAMEGDNQRPLRLKNKGPEETRAYYERDQGAPGLYSYDMYILATSFHTVTRWGDCPGSVICHCKYDLQQFLAYHAVACQREYFLLLVRLQYAPSLRALHDAERVLLSSPIVRSIVYSAMWFREPRKSVITGILFP